LGLFIKLYKYLVDKLGLPRDIHVVCPTFNTCFNDCFTVVSEGTDAVDDDPGLGDGGEELGIGFSGGDEDGRGWYGRRDGEPFEDSCKVRNDVSISASRGE
jgi:hypothetical protein